MTWRVLSIVPVVLFVLIRQIYANLFDVNRDLLTALLSAALICAGLIGFGFRLSRKRPDLLPIDALAIGQLLLAAAVILAYSVTGRIELVQAAAAIYYYCLAPLLIYGGFLIFRLSKAARKAALIAAGLAYLVTVWIAIFEILGIDFWLFQYDRWVLNYNYLGVNRAAGLYGTHIDYGCLSFIAFCAASYSQMAKPSWFARTVSVLAAFGALASMSRVWIVAIAIVFLVNVALRQTKRQRIRAVLAFAVFLAVVYPLADELGMMSMVFADDPYTQESNESRLTLLPRMSQWIFHDYLVTGTGPGTQNGPDGKGAKIVTDFLWLGFLVDFGTLAGSVLVLFRVVLLVYLVVRSCRSRVDTGLRWMTTALSVSFFLASFVDSAFVHPVTIALFYLIVGLFLFIDRPPSASAAPQLA